MIEVISLFFLVVAQNASFTLVSRARNSKSLLYHTLAAIGSNGIWLLVFRNMVTSIDNSVLMWTYLVASVIGSISMHYVAMRWFEKKRPAPVQKPTVGRIVNYYDQWAQTTEGADPVYKPAIVTAVYNVHGTTFIDLRIFNDRLDIFRDVRQGNDVGNWNWPVIK